VTAGATQKAGERTSKPVHDLTEIAYADNGELDDTKWQHILKYLRMSEDTCAAGRA